MENYPPAGKEDDFADVAAVKQAGSVLEDGRVSCLTCHDLTKPPPHLIREGYKVCLICHISLRL